MQPPTENLNPTPNINPAEPPAPNAEPAGLPMPTIGSPKPAFEPVSSVTQPTTDPTLSSAPIIQPTAPSPVMPTTISQSQPIIQPTANAPVIPTPTVFGAPVSAPVTPLSSLEPSAPNVGGANLPGSPDSGTMYIGGAGGLQSIAATGKTRLSYTSPMRKKALIGGGAAAGVVLIAAIFFFGLYMPNTPENVWKTGMKRTGKQVSGLIEKMEDPESAATLEKTKLAVRGSLDMDGKVSTINVDTSADDTKSNTSAKVNINTADMPEINLTTDVKTQLPEKALLPNIYFRIGGFSELGLDAFVPGINAYDDKWIAVEQDYLKQFEDTFASETSESAENITQEDVLSIMNDVNTVSQEYIFTSDPEKAVIKLDEFVETEESEGIKANHYKASIDEDNAQKYCIALRTKLLKNKAIQDNELLGDSDASDIKDDCKATTDEVKTDDTFDVWIDKKYKLFHKVRFYEDLEKQAETYQKELDECEAETRQYSSGDSIDVGSYCDYYKELIVTGEAYSEFGQVYKGKDTFFLFAGEVRDTSKEKTKVKFEMTVDAKQLTLDGKVTVSAKTDESNIKGEVSISTEPYSGEIDSSKPEGSIPIQQVIDELTVAQPAEPDYTYMTSGLKPVTSQLSQWSNWLR